MQHQYDYLFFDLDGTLLDTSPGIRECLAETVHQMHLPQIPPEKIYQFIGPPLNWSFSEHLGMQGEQLDEAISLFRQLYAEKGQYQAVLYPGMEAVLSTLVQKQYKLAVATLKLDRYAESILTHFGLKPYFQFIGGSDSDMRQPTKKMIVERCRQYFSVTDQNKMILIGDSIYDARGALSAGIDFLAVAYGFGKDAAFQQVLQSHSMVAQTPREILKYV